MKGMCRLFYLYRLQQKRAQYWTSCSHPDHCGHSDPRSTCSNCTALTPTMANPQTPAARAIYAKRCSPLHFQLTNWIQLRHWAATVTVDSPSLCLQFGLYLNTCDLKAPLTLYLLRQRWQLSEIRRQASESPLARLRVWTQLVTATFCQRASRQSPLSLCLLCTGGQVFPLASPRWPGGKQSASREAELGSIPAFIVDLYSGRVIPVTSRFSSYAARPWRYRASTGTGWSCVKIRTVWDRKCDLQLLSQCGGTYNCPSRPILELH